ncbi:PREDICTED: uncharacterized protein LOC104810289 [Tarenaya hassleriana]|uniref:uncharacterized protein LOC104810289 n=1 Tax=Tarenaya hassleriana TaxID=28532 RepID=UPI00053C1FF1|nr:PREDICTED: uncharacterized protein LOC104810289 [Tarenaya hassleriana]
MDQMVSKSQFLKNLTKFVIVSIWVFSIFFYLNFYFSRFMIKLVTHTVDKNHMFLFCNGLLVFVVKYSGQVSSVSKEESSDHGAFESHDNVVAEFEQVRRRQTDEFLAEQATEIGEQSETVSINVGTVEEPAKDIYVVVQEDQNIGNEDEEEEEEEEGVTRDNDFEEEGGVGKMTAEELNKKFDEFIRKMKGELKMEPRRHLIVV